MAIGYLDSRSGGEYINQLVSGLHSSPNLIDHSLLSQPQQTHQPIPHPHYQLPLVSDHLTSPVLHSLAAR